MEIRGFHTISQEAKVVHIPKETKHEDVRANHVREEKCDKSHGVLASCQIANVQNLLVMNTNEKRRQHVHE